MGRKNGHGTESYTAQYIPRQNLEDVQFDQKEKILQAETMRVDPQYVHAVDGARNTGCETIPRHVKCGRRDVQKVQ